MANDDEMIVRAAIRDELSGPLERIRAELAATGREASQAGARASTASRGFDRMRGSAASLARNIGGKLYTAAKYGAAGIGILTGAVAFFGIKSAAQIQTATMNIKTMTGSVKVATSMVRQLNKYGNSTTFDTAGLTEAAQQMLTYGINAKEVMPDIKMLGDISMGNQEKLSGLAYVFAQVQGNGHLMGQDLLQMINNGFNPLTDMAKRTGKSMGDLRTEMSKGNISFEDVRQSMVNATKAGGQFYKGASNGSNTLAGAWGNFTGTLESTLGMALLPLLPKLQELLGNVGDLASDLIPKAIHAVHGFIDEWKNGTGKVGQAKDILDKTGHVLEAVFKFIGDNHSTLITFVGVLGAITLGLAAIDAVLAINPFTILIVGIALAVTWLIHLYKTNEQFRAGVQKVWDVVKPLGEFLGKMFVAELKLVATMLLSMAQVGIGAFKLLLTAVVKTFDGILWAADKGLGWIPGLGPKIHKAKEGFAEFSDGVLQMLDGVQAGVGDLSTQLDSLGKQHFTPTIDLRTNVIDTPAALLDHITAGKPGGNGKRKGAGDTSTSRAHGGNLSHTLAAHSSAMAATGARLRITNALVGGGGLGHGSGDHQRGRALDLQGSGLARYGAHVRANGGYASFHGSGSDRHLHTVPAAGDTSISRARRRTHGSGGGGITIEAGAVTVSVQNPADNVDVESAVISALEAWLQDQEERS